MTDVSLTDTLGYCAALMTLVTFAQTRMLSMRVTAIAANVLFIGYGLLGGHHPVAVLHFTLLPLNLIRLAEFSSPLIRCGRAFTKQQTLEENKPMGSRDVRLLPALRTSGTGDLHPLKATGTGWLRINTRLLSPS
jgi:hypothetical protein